MQSLVVVIILGHISWILFGHSLGGSRPHISSLAAANKLTGGGIKSCFSVAAGPSLGASPQSLYLLLNDLLIPHSSCCEPFPLSSIPLISACSPHTERQVMQRRDAFSFPPPLGPPPSGLISRRPSSSAVPLPLRAWIWMYSLPPSTNLSSSFPFTHKQAQMLTCSPTLFPLKLIPRSFHYWQALFSHHRSNI